MKATLERLPEPTRESFRLLKIAAPVFDHPFHFHPEYELTWIEAGKGERFVGDTIGSFVSGDCVLLGPNLPHLFLSEAALSANEATHAPSKAVVVQFRSEVVRGGFLACPEADAVRGLLAESTRGVHFTSGNLGWLAVAFQQLSEATGLVRIARLLEILDRLATTPYTRLGSHGRYRTATSKDLARADRVVRIIQQRFSEPLSLQELADAVELTKEGFCRFFRRVTGQTLTAYLNEVRVREACRRLAETSQPVSSIAFTCGFETLSHFNERFLALRGLSPSRYRRNMHKANYLVNEAGSEAR
jgi:AraC-like DNA-binding protein